MCKKTPVQKFKKELLKELCKKSGHLINIDELGKKYFGTDLTFDEDDKTQIKLRLGLNGILRDLQKINWITVTPIGGFSNAHKQINPFSIDKKRR